MYGEDKEHFRNWLLVDKGLSAKACGDTLSRCKRLNEHVLKSIDEAVFTPESYLVALKTIKEYAVSEKENEKTQYDLTSTLRGAMKKYCEFKNPNTYECYPNGYSLSR